MVKNFHEILIMKKISVTKNTSCHFKNCKCWLIHKKYSRMHENFRLRKYGVIMISNEFLLWADCFHLHFLSLLIFFVQTHPDHIGDFSTLSCFKNTVKPSTAGKLICFAKISDFLL